MTTATRPLVDVRADFPILGRELDGKRLVYLDSAATSQKPAQVIEAIDSHYRHTNANIHRGVYKLAQEATDLFEGARERIARFVGDSYETTIFTRTPPRRSTWWPTRGAAPTSARATRCSSRRWSTTRTSSPGSCSASRPAPPCAT